MIAALYLSVLLQAAVAQEPTLASRRERDVSYLLDTIRRVHPAPFHSHSRADWDAAEANSRRTLPEVSDAEFFLGLSRLVALLDDGHTTLLPSLSSVGALSFPIELRFFDDGLRVVAADPAYGEALGLRVVAIGDQVVEEVLRRARPCLGADNEHGRRRILEMALVFPALHHGLGIAKDPGESSVRVVAGSEEKTIALRKPQPASPAFLTGVPSSWLRAAPQTPSFPDKHPGRNYWFEALPDRNAVYCRFARVEHEEEERFPRFCERLFTEVEATEAARLVIDLRGNRGGNNYLNQPLVHGVLKSSVNRPGGVLVLIDAATFSAAQNCATYLERETWALFVGAPSGARPNHFGDAEEFPLPDSGHVLFCSTQRWQDSDPRDVRRWIHPDVAVETRFTDWIEGRDVVLEAALAYEVTDIEGYTSVLPRAHWKRKTQAPALPQSR